MRKVAIGRNGTSIGIAIYSKPAGVDADGETADAKFLEGMFGYSRICS